MTSLFYLYAVINIYIFSRHGRCKMFSLYRILYIIMNISNKRYW